MNNMKDRLIRLSGTALALAAAAAVLAGCGSRKVSEGYWELSKISEGKTTVSGDALEDYGLEKAYIVTTDDGEGYAVLFDLPADFEINEDKGNFVFDTGKVSYSLSGKKLTLADSNVTMVFEKSKKDAPAKPDKVAKSDNKKTGSDEETSSLDWMMDKIEGEGSSEDESGDSGAGPYNLTYSKPREFFEGDWYGWMTITGRTDFWKQIDGEVYDAMCKVEMDDDNFGTVTIFDAGMPYDKPMAKVKVVVNDSGSDPKKGYMADDNSGFFLDGDFDMHNKWDIDPGVFDWSNYMMISGTYIDGNGEDAMDYVFHFKKWGDDWSDFSQKPPHFDWYKKQIDAGKPMPDAPPEN